MHRYPLIICAFFLAGCVNSRSQEKREVIEVETRQEIAPDGNIVELTTRRHTIEGKTTSSQTEVQMAQDGMRVVGQVAASSGLPPGLTEAVTLVGGAAMSYFYQRARHAQPPQPTPAHPAPSQPVRKRREDEE
jgi:hypothetical protein